MKRTKLHNSSKFENIPKDVFDHCIFPHLEIVTLLYCISVLKKRFYQLVSSKNTILWNELLFRDIKRKDFEIIKCLLRNSKNPFYAYKQLYSISFKIILHHVEFKRFLKHQENIYPSFRKYSRVGTVVYTSTLDTYETFSAFDLSPILELPKNFYSSSENISRILQQFRKVFLRNINYYGQTVNLKPDGKGTMYFENGNKYVGDWKNDKKEGQGTYTWNNGNKYVGNCKNDKIEGQGTYTWNDGEQYVGNWKNDNAEGQGTFTWNNGEQYVGNWKNGKKEGQGTIFHVNGNKYVGNWKNDKLQGQGIFTWKNEDSYSCIWKEFHPSIHGIFTYSNGKIFKGTILSAAYKISGILIIEKE